MKIIQNWPPNATDEDKKVKNVITSYRGDIYLCAEKEVREDLIVHEIKHIEQAGKNFDSWLKRCETDTEFYLKQEIEAYKAQLEFIEETRGHADMLTATLSFAKFLSSEVYGSAITMDEAIKKLKICV